MKIYSTLITILILVICCSSIFGQQRTCGSNEKMNTLFTNPKFKLDWENRQAKFKQQIQNNIAGKALCSSPVILPVAIHYQGINNPDQACLITLAQDQIRVLNEDYQGTNADISNWINTDAAYFPGLNYGETCIQFCLAINNHPSGYGLTEGQPAVTFNTTSGDSDGNFSGYINIFVRNISFLGYSPLGGSGNGDGVVIDDQAFGSNVVSGCGGVAPGAPYNLGRTLTHELGHYLNLDHIWGGGCNSDDGVNDTPESQSEYYGCPSLPSNSCNSNDMFMNYMDYVNDVCMYVFSAGQSTRMENYTAANLQNVINNGFTVCGPIAAPTCTDGYQNGDETGVDCGGSCPDVCPTCSDGTQNGDEIGIDCGGADCDACPCAGGDLTITINFDDYPEETSWTVTDNNGSTVTSGGTYGNQADGSTLVINSCLPAGCYDFNMLDEYGDGMCCGYGNGSYEVTDGDGNVLASGAQFQNSETTNFCFTEPNLLLSLKTMLEGPYDMANQAMNTNLAQAALIPDTEPYTGLGYVQVSNPGGEMIENPAILTATGPNAIIDWMFVELHDATDPTIILATRSGLLQSDGDVVDMDGVSPLSFDGLATGDYYVAVRHRNHLGVMTEAVVSLSSVPTLVDFTVASTATYGLDDRNDINSMMTLWTGNATSDNSIDANDRSTIWNSRNQIGYLMGDVNLDGLCDADDRSYVWNNRNKALSIP